MVLEAEAVVVLVKLLPAPIKLLEAEAAEAAELSLNAGLTQLPLPGRSR